MELLDKKKYIFGGLFLIANKLQVIGDQYLDKDGMTIKQWLLTLMISQFGENAPTLSEVSERMGSSRQNVKQLALKLEEKDFLRMEKDDSDARVIRLKLTQKCQDFWDRRIDLDNAFITDLFGDLNSEEIGAIYSGFDKLYQKLEILEKPLKSQEGNAER